MHFFGRRGAFVCDAYFGCVSSGVFVADQVHYISLFRLALTNIVCWDLRTLYKIEVGENTKLAMLMDLNCR